MPPTKHNNEKESATAVADPPLPKHHDDKDTKPAAPAPAPVDAPVVTPLANPIVSPLVTPVAGRKAEHFIGPVVSGHPGYLQGQALLAFMFDIDIANGTFTGSAANGGTLNVPAGIVLWKTITLVTTAFNGTTPLFKLGTTSGASDIASLALGTLGNTEAAALSTAFFASGGTLYASLTIGGAPTTGHATIALLFFGPPARPWS